MIFFQKFNSQKPWILLVLAIITACGDAPAGLALATEVNDQTSAVTKETATLKTKIPRPESKKPPQYILDLKNSQSLRPIDSEPVNAVEVPSERILLEPESQILSDEDSVPLVRPQLQAFISVQRNLSPLSMDAGFIERVGLADVLNCTIARNLGIENSLDALHVQKYAYLSSLSRFLPDINSGYSLYGLQGSIPAALLGGGSGTSTLPSSLQLLQAGFTYTAYRGGAVLFGALEQKHRFQASRASLKGTFNDVLLDAANRYYDLVLNEALLEIRTRAVAISNEQFRMNANQEKVGTATGLDVLQSQSQLASDQQNLVDQQSTRRQSAIRLATVVNSSYLQDLVSNEASLRKKRLIPKMAPISELLQIAVDNRPELKQYEELRLAAKRAIVSAGAPLQPNVSLGGTVYGIGTGSNSLSSIYLLNFSVNWRLGSLGTTDLANIQRARWQARQATVQAKQIFQSVFEQVHIAYDQSLAADSRIERASAQIMAAEEELRIAQKRMQAGLGLNIDVLNAQRDLTQAAINKVRAIVDFNVAQVQLLHDVGLISVNTLTSGAKI